MPVIPPSRPPGDPKLPTPVPLPGPAAPIAGGPGGGFGPGGVPVPSAPPALGTTKPGDKPMRVEDFAKGQTAGDKGDGKTGLAGNRGFTTERQVKEAIDQLKNEKDPILRAKITEDVKRYAEQKKTWDEANAKFKGGKDGYQTGQ